MNIFSKIPTYVTSTLQTDELLAVAILHSIAR